MFWEIMIFNFAVITILILSLGNKYFQYNSQPNLEVNKEKVIEEKLSRSTWEPSIEDPLFSEFFFDLDSDGKNEKIVVYSTLGKEIGDEHTDIYLNNGKKPILNLGGYFDGIEIHSINHQGKQILEIRTAAGHSIETNFYTYKNGRLKIVPVSTAKPPSFYGIVSRNVPELRDSDNDGVLELFAYYRHFPPEKQRTVELYKFDDHQFVKIREYEEDMPELYL